MKSSSQSELTALAGRFIARLISSADMQSRLRDSLLSGDCAAPALLWTAERRAEMPWTPEPPASWQPAFVDRIASAAAPGRHSLHAAGAYYCLDLSSVFEACVTREAAASSENLSSGSGVIIDVCAAPGGKSIFASVAYKPRALVANEVIGKRHGALVSNFNRCKIPNAAIVRLDPKELAERARSTADLVIVDAPCTGQSLIARGEDSHGCFHPVLIGKNAKRQRRILAESSALVAPGGFLAYMTCTYSREENEENVEWLLKTFPDLQAVSSPGLCDHQSVLSDVPCYRLWPFEGFGAGGFCALFRKEANGIRASLNPDILQPRWTSRSVTDES